MRALSVAKVGAIVVASVVGSVPAWAQPQFGVDVGRGGFDAITRQALDTVASVTVTIPDTGSPWNCVATCTIEIDDFAVPDPDVDGRCAVASDGAEVAGTDRRFELNDDPEIGLTAPFVVTTTGGLAGVTTGDHLVACACAKVTADEPIYNVNTSSITVSCSEFSLD